MFAKKRRAIVQMAANMLPPQLNAGITGGELYPSIRIPVYTELRLRQPREPRDARFYSFSFSAQEQHASMLVSTSEI